MKNVRKNVYNMDETERNIVRTFVKGDNFMDRNVTKEFEKWLKSTRKTALFVDGARQIGKTYSLREFGRAHYAHFAELNFLEDPAAKAIFDGNLDADTLVTNLTAYLRTPLEPGNTVVFFDEIQECPNARTAIKFLVEDGRYDYMESGSLLGVNYKHVPSMPVGFETVVHMYPMDFEEFCLANGVPENTFHYLRECYETKTQVTPAVHETMLELFRYYVVVGGMPAAVQTFVDTRDIGQVMTEQKNILALYRKDIGQYTSEAERVKVTDIFDRIPSQLDDKNRRFVLSSISSNARQREYEAAFLWLSNAGVALPCYNLTEPKTPLKLNEKRSLFKLFLNDVGLLCAAGLDQVQFDILQGDVSVNMGSVLENVFAEELKTAGFDLRYYNGKKIGEVDFIVQKGHAVIPVEVKSGKDYHVHAALNNVLSVEEWGIGDALVFCMGNVEQVKTVTYLPWYMIMFFKQNQLPENMVVALDLSALAPRDGQ